MQNILHKSSWCEKDWNARMTISIHFLQATLISITNWMSIEIRYVSLDLIGVDLWALQWSIPKYIKRLYITTFFWKMILHLFLENFGYLMEESITLHLTCIVIIRIFMKVIKTAFLFFIKLLEISFFANCFP